MIVPMGGTRGSRWRDRHTTVMVFAVALVSLACQPISQDGDTAGSDGSATAFETGLWPGEGRPRLVAGTTTLALRTEPRTDAPTGTALHVERGQPVEFEETMCRTRVPGRLKVLRDSEVTGRRLGSIVRLSRDDFYSGQYSTGSLPVRAGEVIDYLQYLAEGSCLVRIHGEVLDADPCPDSVADPVGQFELETEPQTEWWVRVQFEGRLKGWVLVDGITVREVGRSF